MASRNQRDYKHKRVVDQWKLQRWSTLYHKTLQAFRSRMVSHNHREYKQKRVEESWQLRWVLEKHLGNLQCRIRHLVRSKLACCSLENGTWLEGMRELAPVVSQLVVLGFALAPTLLSGLGIEYCKTDQIHRSMGGYDNLDSGKWIGHRCPKELVAKLVTMLLSDLGTRYNKTAQIGRSMADYYNLGLRKLMGRSCPKVLETGT